MKDPKGFAQFLGEDKKEKKSSPKPAAKKSSKKKKERKESKGKDDQRYIALMDEYKRSRHKNRAEANRIHHKARELKQDGDVSKDAILAGQYI